MKRISVTLFAMVALLCIACGLSYYRYETMQNQTLEDSRNQNESSTTDTTLESVGGDAQKNESRSDQNQAGDDTAGEAKETGAGAVSSDIRYIIKYQNEKLVVFQKDGKTVYEETDIDRSHLSEEMLSKLADGIPVSSEKELYSLLESFSS